MIFQLNKSHIMKAIIFKKQKNTKRNSEFLQLSNNELRSIEGGVAKMHLVTNSDGTISVVVLPN